MTDQSDNAIDDADIASAFAEFCVALDGVDFRRALHQVIVNRWPERDPGRSSLVSVACAYAGVSYAKNEENFRANLRRNQGSKKVAAAVYFYLSRKEPFVAAQVDQLIKSSPSDAEGAWNRLVFDALDDDQLKLVVRDHALEIVELSEPRQRSRSKIRLGQDFRLSGTASVEGFLLAFQRYGATWHTLPMCAGKVGAGRFLVPNVDGVDRYLVEHWDAGLHAFAIALVPVGDEVSLSWLNNDSSAVPLAVLDEWSYRAMQTRRLKILSAEVRFIA